MRTIVNARFLMKPPTGVTRVGRELLRALLAELADTPAERRPAITIATPRRGAAAFPLHEGVSVVPGPENIPQEQLMPLQDLSALYLNFCNTMPLLAPRAALWLHDAQVFDAAGTYSRFYRAWHQTIFHVARLRGVQIVTVSEFSRSRLVAHGAHPDRVMVIHNGGDHLQRETPDHSISEQFGLSRDRFVLLMGSPARHKNLPFAIDALTRLGPPDLKIAVVGLSQAGAYQRASVAAGDQVAILPQITDAQLRALYKQAFCVVVPSLFEGFGLPAAEAMWEGAPMALSDRASLPEIGGDAALYFDPTDADSLAQAVRRLEDEGLREALRVRGAARRGAFTWRNAARQVIERFLAPRAEARVAAKAA